MTLGSRAMDSFANKRANRAKVLVHDGIGIWRAAHCLHCACQTPICAAHGRSGCAPVLPLR